MGANRAAFGQIRAVSESAGGEHPGSWPGSDPPRAPVGERGGQGCCFWLTTGSGPITRSSPKTNKDAGATAGALGVVAGLSSQLHELIADQVHDDGELVSVGIETDRGDREPCHPSPPATRPTPSTSRGLLAAAERRPGA